MQFKTLSLLPEGLVLSLQESFGDCPSEFVEQLSKSIGARVPHRVLKGLADLKRACAVQEQRGTENDRPLPHHNAVVQCIRVLAEDTLKDPSYWQAMSYAARLLMNNSEADWPLVAVVDGCCTVIVPYIHGVYVHLPIDFRSAFTVWFDCVAANEVERAVARARPRGCSFPVWAMNSAAYEQAPSARECDNVTCHNLKCVRRRGPVLGLQQYIQQFHFPQCQQVLFREDDPVEATLCDKALPFHSIMRLNKLHVVTPFTLNPRPCRSYRRSIYNNTVGTGLVNLFDWEFRERFGKNAVLAGGAALCALKGNFFDMSDMDLFLVDVQSEDHALQLCNEIAKWFTNQQNEVSIEGGPGVLHLHAVRLDARGQARGVKLLWRPEASDRV